MLRNGVGYEWKQALCFNLFALVIRWRSAGFEIPFASEFKLVGESSYLLRRSKKVKVCTFDFVSFVYRT